MTRQEAIKVLEKSAISYFGPTLGREMLKAVKAKKWGLAAQAILQHNDNWATLVLADALWEGRK